MYDGILSGAAVWVFSIPQRLRCYEAWFQLMAGTFKRWGLMGGSHVTRGTPWEGLVSPGPSISTSSPPWGKWGKQLCSFLHMLPHDALLHHRFQISCGGACPPCAHTRNQGAAQVGELHDVRIKVNKAL